MREAKAEYYEALAGLKNADKAYREAEARYEDACTKLKEAEVAAKELENAYQELVNAKKEADDEIAIAEAKAKLENTLVYWETELTKQETALAQAEYNLQQELRNIAANSIGLNAAESKVLGDAISEYEQALTDYNATYRQLYNATRNLFAKQYDVEAAIESLNEETTQDVEENTVKWAEDYEDSVAFYSLVKVAFEEKLAEYVLTDDPAVWAAELEEIQDSLDFWRYQANIVDADMAKKFANEYYDGVKAWNEAYAAYVKANEPEAPKGYDPKIIYFRNLYGQAVYEYALPQHMPSDNVNAFIRHLNNYLWEYKVSNEYKTSKAFIENDVLSVDSLNIWNYEEFLNGDPEGKETEWIGLNGILETLERDLVLNGDTTTVARYKKDMEDAKKEFYSADSVVREGLFAYPPFADTLALAKEAYANMRQEAKALADAQTALIKAISDYAKGLGKSSILWAGNPISSNADSVALFNAIKNFAQARVDYFGDGSILSEYSELTEEEAIALFTQGNSLVYIKADNMYQPKRDSVALQDIEFSGFHQAAVLPSYLNPISNPTSNKDEDDYYWAQRMVFNSLYGGAGLSLHEEPIPFYVGYPVNLGNTYWDEAYEYPGTAGQKSGEFWKYAYEVGQQVPAYCYKKDAFIKAIWYILEASKWVPDDFYSEVSTSVDFWTKLASVIKSKGANDFATTGLLDAKTVTDPDTKEVKVMIGDGEDAEEVISQTVIDLGNKVYNNLEAFAKTYNAYWGAGSTDLARKSARWTKKGTEVSTQPSKDEDDGWQDLVIDLVKGNIDGVKDTYGFYNWSVKTFTEPHNVLAFGKSHSNNAYYPNNIKELRIILDNIGLDYKFTGSKWQFVDAKLFNSSDKVQTLFAKMIHAQNLYEMYSNAKDALAIVEALKGVDEDIREAAEPKEEAVLAYQVAYVEYAQDYVTFYKTLTGDVKGADEVVKENTYPAGVDWEKIVSVLEGRVNAVKADEDYILNHISGGKWTVGGEMKVMAEKYLPTYPADVNATQQLKGHSAEMIELYEGLYNALDKTYLIAVVMKDGALTDGQLVTIPLPWGEYTFVWGVSSFEEAYKNVIKKCNEGIDLCDAKIAYFERLIALEEAGFGKHEAEIMALEHEVERLTQKLADAQIKLDVAKAKYDEAVAAYAE